MGTLAALSGQLLGQSCVLLVPVLIIGFILRPNKQSLLIISFSVCSIMAFLEWYGQCNAQESRTDRALLLLSVAITTAIVYGLAALILYLTRKRQPEGGQ
jgi:lipopolysaccharide export LptBFGC system permease protein LptF